MTRTRYRIYNNAAPHFFTATIVGWLPVFTRPEAVQIVFDSWHFLRQHERLEIYAYVILENHLHLIASSPNLSKEIGDFKSFTARKIIDLLTARNAAMLLEQLAWHKEHYKADRDYQFWQEGSHPEEIQSDEMMLQKIEYIHDNPVKRGYVSCPEHWRYSSAANYLGLPGLFPVRTDWGSLDAERRSEKPMIDWKLHLPTPENVFSRYKCGLRAGQRVALRKDLMVRDDSGNPTGTIYPRGEVWIVLPGLLSDPVLWLQCPNGERCTWDDSADEIAEWFVLVGENL